jgi:hypothetical protein
VKKESGLNFIIIFKGDTIPDYPEIERSLKTALDKLINELNKKLPDYR